MKKTNLDEIEVLEDGWKLSNGKLKMKLFKMIVEKMGLSKLIILAEAELLKIPPKNNGIKNFNLEFI